MAQFTFEAPQIEIGGVPDVRFQGRPGDSLIKATRAEGQALIADTVMEGLVSTTQEFVRVREARRQQMAQEAAEKAKRDAFKAGAETVQAAVRQWTDWKPQTEGEEKNPAQLEYLIRTRLLGFAASDAGAMLDKQSWDILHRAATDMVKATVGERHVTLDGSGTAHVFTINQDGMQVQSIAQDVDFDVQMQAFLMEVAPNRAMEIQRQVERGDISEDRGLDMLDNLTNSLANVEQILMDAKIAEAQGRLLALNEKELNNQAILSGFHMVDEFSRSMIQSINETTGDGHFERGAEEYRRSMESFFTQSEFIQLASVYNVDAAILRKNYREYVDAQATLLELQDERVIKQRGRDVVMAETARTRAEMERAELRYAQGVDPGTRWMIQAAPNLNEMVAMERFLRNTHQRVPGLMEISNAFQVSRSQFTNTFWQMRDNLTADKVGQRDATFGDAMNVLEDIRDYISAWGEGQYMTYPDAAGLVALVRTARHNQVFQEDYPQQWQQIEMLYRQVKSKPEVAELLRAYEQAEDPDGAATNYHFRDVPTTPRPIDEEAPRDSFLQRLFKR